MTTKELATYIINCFGELDNLPHTFKRVDVFEDYPFEAWEMADEIAKDSSKPLAISPSQKTVFLERTELGILWPFLLSTTLQVLNLPNCYIRSLPTSVTLPNLRILDLSENPVKLSELAVFCGGLATHSTNLQALNISYTVGQTIGEAYANFNPALPSSLTELNMENVGPNVTIDVFAILRQCPVLKTLNLAHCSGLRNQNFGTPRPCSSGTNGEFQPSALEELVLNFCGMEKWPSIATPQLLPGLKGLHLMGNSIKVVPPYVASFSGLDFLDLSTNHDLTLEADKPPPLPKKPIAVRFLGNSIVSTHGAPLLSYSDIKKNVVSSLFEQHHISLLYEDNPAIVRIIFPGSLSWSSHPSLANAGNLKKLYGIDAIIYVAAYPPPPDDMQGVCLDWYKFLDAPKGGADKLLREYVAINNRITELRRAGRNVMIACAAGWSRSGAITAMHLLMTENAIYPGLNSIYAFMKRITGRDADGIMRKCFIDALAKIEIEHTKTMQTGDHYEESPCTVC